MRRINAEIQGGKVQEYWRLSSLSDAEVQYLDKQKIRFSWGINKAYIKEIQKGT